MDCYGPASVLDIDQCPVRVVVGEGKGRDAHLGSKKFSRKLPTRHVQLVNYCAVLHVPIVGPACIRKINC